jgi:hypothetical protein
VKRRDLEGWLREHGARLIRSVGPHDVWGVEDGRTAPMPRRREIDTYTGRGICGQLGIERPPFK